jgi:energy-coupling factor transporter transmembrane protein EcfT
MKMLIVPLIFNLFLIIVLKLSLYKVARNLLQISVLVIITVLFNLILDNIENSVMVGLKLLLVCNSTYIFAAVFSYNALGQAIQILMYPLKIFGINPKDIGLLVCIAIAFIPILRDELQQIKNMLIVKGVNMRAKNVIENANLIFKPFFISIFQRLNEIEDTLRAKSYQ